MTYLGINYKTIQIMSISNFCHGTNYYHLVPLYDV